MKSGFTLLEMLVVVLIVGILLSFALPEYQRAVMKADLSRYMPSVRAIYQAEEHYFHQKGVYTDDLSELVVDMTFKGCSLKTQSYGKYYECEKGFRFGVFNNASNVQVGNEKIRYLQVLADFKDNGVNFKKGDVVCFAKGGAARKVCRSLGPGTEKKGQGWEYIYIM